MPADYTTTGLIASVKRRGSIPTNQPLFQPDDFVALANDELQDYIVPLIMSVREEYFVNSVDVAVVSGTAEYSIPSLSAGMSLRDVVFLNPNNEFVNIPRLQLEEVAGGVWFNDFLRPAGFYVKDNSIVLYPTPQAPATLRLFFHRRTNFLVNAATKAGQISAIDTNTNELTLNFVPSTWTTGTTLDVISNEQPFNLKATGLTVVSASFPTVVVDSVEGLSVGDWVALEGDSPIPQVPIEAQHLLAQAVVVKCLEAMGDREGMKAAEAKKEQMEQKLLVIINPRVKGAPKKVTNAGNGIFDYNRTYPWRTE